MRVGEAAGDGAVVVRATTDSLRGRAAAAVATEILEWTLRNRIIWGFVYEKMKVDYEVAVLAFGDGWERFPVWLRELQ